MSILDHPRCVSCVHWGEPEPDGLAWCRMPEAFEEEPFMRTPPDSMCEMHSSAEQAARHE